MKRFTHMIVILLIAFTMSNCKKESNPAPTPVGTALKITVKSTANAPVTGATVQLFVSFADWEQKTNVISTRLSGDDGTVTFDNLSDKKYYYFASKDCFNNGSSNVSTAGAISLNTITPAATYIEQNGTIALHNSSNNPYRIFIDGVANFDQPGNTTKMVTYKPIGNYTIRVLQLSGYVVSPTDQTFTGLVNCGATLTVNFPQ